jgi:UDP-N-acetylglucosamine diphosphorylase/glucosamine-1-phosphate N-acetyltransferase
MSSIIFFEDAGYRNLLPLTYWRTPAELRTGYARLVDHILAALGGPQSWTLYCRPGLAEVTAERLGRPVNVAPDSDNVILLNARLLGSEPIRIDSTPGAQWDGDVLLAACVDATTLARLTPERLLDAAETKRLLAGLPPRTWIESPRLIRYPWDLVHRNKEMLQLGWQRAGSPAECVGRICNGAHLLNEKAIHVGEGSTIKPGVTLDAENGPIFIGLGVTVLPNCSIEGPCYIGDGSLIQPGAALRDAVSIGTRCKVGGELEASILHGFSNKQHDGFLGHSYVAEWVNMAADTVNSDLKNTYGPIRVPINGVEVDSGEIFVGLTMGDHSKTGIGQMFPTGGVVGFGCNVATCTFAPRFVPSFTWLTGEGTSRYDVEKCLDVARRVMARRQREMTDAETALFRQIPSEAARIESANGASRGRP